MNKEVIILLATYNGELYLRELLDSIINQTYKNWKLIISDDGSTDNTRNIIKEYEAKYQKQIMFVDLKQKFGSATKHFMNLLNKYQDSDYIMFCDQDDVWHSNKIEITLNKMNKLEEISDVNLVFTDLRVVDDNLNLLHSSFMEFMQLNSKAYPEKLILENCISGCTMMLNKKLIKLVIKNYDNEKIIIYDWWITLIASSLGKIGYADEATIDYRQHNSNVVGATDKNSLKTIFIKAKNRKENHQKKLLQANEIYNLYNQEMNEESKKLYKAIHDNYNLSKINRLTMYRKYKMYPKNILQKISIVIWG